MGGQEVGHSTGPGPRFHTSPFRLPPWLHGGRTMLVKSTALRGDEEEEQMLHVPAPHSF